MDGREFDPPLPHAAPAGELRDAARRHHVHPDAALGVPVRRVQVEPVVVARPSQAIPAHRRPGVRANGRKLSC